jgi:hypothetical protein
VRGAARANTIVSLGVALTKCDDDHAPPPGSAETCNHKHVTTSSLMTDRLSVSATDAWAIRESSAGHSSAHHAASRPQGRS